jgi:catechol 2,3-dioxygenase-like lactoylglutathione lyase family enzyme
VEGKTQGNGEAAGARVMIAILMLWTATAFAQSHFHHVHLNSTDPAKAIEFYASHFDCEPRKYEGKQDAVWAQKSWLLFNKVSKPPASSVGSAIWHIGWGAEDMQATYRKQLNDGAKFETPITDISSLTNTPGFYYAYVDGPDHALIELNTASHHHFGHLHLFSDDPIAAGEFYINHFGAVRRGRAAPSREPRFYNGVQVGPSVSLMSDNVNIIIFPSGYLKRTNLVSTKGRVFDHIAFSTGDVVGKVKELRAAGVKVLSVKKNAAFIEGPDRIAIEVVK